MKFFDRFLPLFPFVAVLILLIASGTHLSCKISPQAHFANGNEALDYAAELDECRRQARIARSDGGAEAYMQVYESCAQDKDQKHGVKP